MVRIKFNEISQLKTQTRRKARARQNFKRRAGDSTTADTVGSSRAEEGRLLVEKTTHKSMPSLSCDPVLINFLTYAGTLALFTAVFFTDMPHLPYPIQDCLLNSQDAKYSRSVQYLAMALWNIHFFRRTSEVLFVHIYKRRMPLVDCIGAPLYYWFLALFISWSINGDSYQTFSLISAIIGTVIFLIGEAGNAWCHLKLRFFRTKEQDASLVSPETGHIMPHGVFFNHISCPHYTFEITTWIGFFLVVWTMPSALLLLFTIITLVIYADKKHTAYIGEFDGEYNRPLYPESRRRLIPFIF